MRMGNPLGVGPLPEEWRAWWCDRLLPHDVSAETAQPQTCVLTKQSPRAVLPLRVGRWSIGADWPWE